METAEKYPHIARDVDSGSGNEGGGGGLLSPFIRTTLDSERRSIMSPSRVAIHGVPTDIPNIQGSRSSLRSRTSRTGMSDVEPSEDSGSVDEANAAHKNAVGQTSAVVSEFIVFIEACKNLETYLRNFTHQVQKLGSALRLAEASRNVHRDLQAVRVFFEKNAQTLNILLNKIKTTKSAKLARRRKRRGTLTNPRPSSSLTGNDTDNLIGALVKLADSVDNFTIAIIDFEDYTDQEGNSTLEEFQIELRVLSGGLEFFGGDGETDELRRYVTARAGYLKSHLDNVSAALERFEKIGIPCISFAQKRSTRMLLNAATVATFFAGVAATTLQYSVALTSKKREVAINTLWFSSLVLSTCAAITGMLALTWRLAVFSSPKRSLPWYIRFWIRSGYLALLIASVIAFLAGLVIYIFDSQHRVAFWIVTGFTVFCAIGLAHVTLLFVKERWNFTHMREQMRKEFSPVQLFYDASEESWLSWLRFHLIDQLRKKRLRLLRESSYVSGSAHHGEQGSFFETMWFALRRFVQLLPWSEKGLQHRPTQDSEAGIDGGGAGEPKRPHMWKKGSRQPTSARRITPGRAQSDPLQQRPPACLVDDPQFAQWYRQQVRHLGLCMSAPVEQRALHLQFSPNGRWLVVCYKFECCVFNVEKSFEHHQTLRHTRKKAKQVEWSPNSRRLLTRINDDVKIWSVDETDTFVYEMPADLRDVNVTDIQWLNNDEFLAIADELTFFRVNVAGEEVTWLEFSIEWDNELLELYYLYTMPESELVMIVGARKIEGLPEEKAIDCIIVYKMGADAEETQSHISQSSRVSRSSRGTMYKRYAPGSIKRRIPLLTDVVSLSFGLCDESHRHMLISYLSKPPEIWTIDVTTGNVHLEHQLKKNAEAEHDPEAEWGDVFFIGPTESTIACAEDGTMHFWDLKSHEHFHSLRLTADEEEVEELPVVTWIQSIEIPMMATAAKGLSLKIWAPVKERERREEGKGGGGVETQTPINAGSNGHEHKAIADPERSSIPYAPSPTNFAYLHHATALLDNSNQLQQAPDLQYSPDSGLVDEILYSSSPEASVKGDEKDDKKCVDG